MMSITDKPKFITTTASLLLTSALAVPCSSVIVAAAHAAPYAKVCNSGQVAGTGSCPAAPALGPGTNEWACTIDQATQLMWEVKTNGGLRSYRSEYTSFDDPTKKQKSNGTNPIAAEVSSTGNVVGYMNAVNTLASALCGKNDWRRPTHAELKALVTPNTTPNTMQIDSAFFPWTGFGHPVRLPYTTTTPAGGGLPDKLYMVDFYTGQTTPYPRDKPSHVRLVTKAPVVVALPDCGEGATNVGQQCYGYLIEYASAVWPAGSGHYQGSYSFSTLPKTYPNIPRCTNPIFGPPVKPCMHKYKWVKVTPINKSPQVTNPPSSVEVFPPE